MSYAELFCQSNFSFLSGASHPEELIQRAHFLRYQALAITDECSVAGIVRAYSEQQKHDLPIKLIVGSYFRFQDELQLVLLCPHKEAYSELCRIITNARRRSPKGEYQLQEWDLKTCQHCLVLWLPHGDRETDKHWAEWLKKHYKQRLWLGVQRHLKANEQDYLAHCKQLANQWHIPISACGGVLMHEAERLPLQHIVSAIKAGTPVAQLGRNLLSNAERCLRPMDKIRSLFPSEWIEASTHIAQRCSFSPQELKYQYPQELIPAGYTPKKYLRECVLKGMQVRFAQPPENYFAIKRIIAKELKLIAEMEYEYFFLTIYDIVQFAKQQRILYQGRGSAANSVVCYCLEITAVDPRQISVLFERFISKERNEPPDIDVDFEHERREEVIQYIYQKYGRERTALAATVTTYRFKSALREVGKALGIAEIQLDYFIKNINRRDRGLDWQAQIVELGLASSASQSEKLVNLVEELKGFPRHLSQHVGGFVISAGPLYQLVPVENAAMPERTVIQWDKDDLESLALLKVDVLALGMLTAIRKMFQLVWQHYGRKLSIADITRKQDDANVYRMIQQADTVGVFQIESRAQMSMLPRLKPRNYYDLVIQIAIVRPGPIQGDMVHPFLRRRDGKEPETYPSEEVKAVLKRTRGVPIFQEQVIKLAMVAAGFTGGEADQLRRAMASWKKNGELLKFKSKLISGMMNRGYNYEYAERIFKQICGFGEYGFPESHSASFAILAYVSSWLKYYYPEAFYTGLMNSWPMGFYTPSQLVQDARQHDIKVLPVCINHSNWDHQMEKQSKGYALRLGLRQVKGFSASAAHILLQNRPTQGYKYVNQLKQLTIKSNELQALASADAMHQIEQNRYQTRWALLNRESELPLFNELHEPTQGYQHQPDDIENLLEDYQSTRLTLKQHPIALLQAQGQLGKFTSARELANARHQSIITAIGMVTGRQAPGTASGVTFITLEDHTGNINVIVWRATARAQKQAYLKAHILKVTGVLERGDGGVTHLIAGKLEDQSHLLAQLSSRSRDFH
ncbi:error-prone DNA polymerase [Planctobacterium marinum]|uniref:Error-prone DNA polymerase n=1 Tax=Planctobacterium marinum TaxID=1631968 RepID=A0AA48HRI0_9ALTE|nr:error-prone DNA polymerase [Planctobacterium marinum]